MSTIETFKPIDSILVEEPDAKQNITLLEKFSVLREISTKIGEVVMATQTQTRCGPGCRDSDSDHSDY